MLFTKSTTQFSKAQFILIMQTGKKKEKQDLVKFGSGKDKRSSIGKTILVERKKYS